MRFTSGGFEITMFDTILLAVLGIEPKLKKKRGGKHAKKKTLRSA